MVIIEQLNRFTFNGGNIQRSGWPTWGVSRKSEFMSFCVFVKMTWLPWSAHLKGGRGSQVGPDWATNSRDRASTEEVTFMSVPPWLLLYIADLCLEAKLNIAMHLDMKLHTVYKSQCRQPQNRLEIPVSQSREWVGAISRVEVTPSRDWVFSAGKTHSSFY